MIKSKHSQADDSINAQELNKCDELHQNVLALEKWK